MVETATMEDAPTVKVVVMMAHIGVADSGFGRFEVAWPCKWWIDDDDIYGYGDAQPKPQWDTAEQAIADWKKTYSAVIYRYGGDSTTLQETTALDDRLVCQNCPGSVLVYKYLDCYGDVCYEAVWVRDVPMED
jgi:hypothetical protein